MLHFVYFNSSFNKEDFSEHLAENGIYNRIVPDGLIIDKTDLQRVGRRTMWINIYYSHLLKDWNKWKPNTNN